MLIQHEYETIYVVKPEVPEDTLKTISEKVETIIGGNEGTLLFFDDWGKRKLAYPIQKNSKGHFVYVRFVGPGTLIAELERNLGIDDKLLRFLTVRLAVDVDLSEAQAAAEEIVKQKAEEAAKRAAEEAVRAAEEAAYAEMARKQAEAAAAKEAAAEAAKAADAAEAAAAAAAAPAAAADADAAEAAPAEATSEEG
ncbi:MAG: small subunit ribosomal protein S6 [Cognaticolwellia sp.]|jgi:small subunit ribosomal protein S6